MARKLRGLQVDGHLLESSLPLENKRAVAEYRAGHREMDRLTVVDYRVSKADIGRWEE